MKGIVLQFRRGRKTVRPRHFLIEVSGTDSRESASKLVGKIVSWKSPGKVSKIINGRISSAHGNKGVIRAIFERGLPGQAIGTEVSVHEANLENKSSHEVKPKKVEIARESPTQKTKLVKLKK